MRKIKILLIFIISLMLLTGCSTFTSSADQTDKPNTPPANKEQTAGNGPEDGEDTQGEENNEGNQEAQDNNDYKTDSGRFAGRADSNFIEIKISGVPEEMSYKTFMLSEELKKEFDSLNLEIDQVIKFKYIMNEHDQGVIIEITKI